MPVEAHEDGPVVGDELGEEADDEQRQEDPQRPEAALIGTKEAEAPLSQRRDAPAEESRLRRRGFG